MPTNRIFLEEHTWPELRESAAQERVVRLLVGIVGRHGPHLLSTDCITSREIRSRLDHH